MDKEKLKKTLLAKISSSKEYKTTVIEPAAKERLQRFHADPDLYAEKFTTLSDYDIADTSVSNAVERICAALMKIIMGGEDIGSIKGRTASDDPNGEVMEELVNWQIEYENQGYLKLYAWVKECLYQLYSVVKVTQHRDVEESEDAITIPLMAVERFQAECDKQGADIVSVEQNPQSAQLVDVTVSYTKLTKNYPEIENVPASELIWTPNARNLQEADLVGHIKQVTIDHLRRNIKTKGPNGQTVGMYDRAAVEEVAKGGSTQETTSQLELSRQDNWGNESVDTDDPNRKVYIVECYIKYDINGDGLLEDVIATICDDTNTLLRCEENQDGLPFCIISPLFDPYRIVPERGSMDNLGQWQDLLTVIIRLTIENLAVNNNPQQAIDESRFADINELLDNAQFLRINGDPRTAIAPVGQVALAPYTLNLIEMVKGWGEEASNVNRYNQGIDANSLNKTATGMQLLVNQGSQALELIMRNIAETGLKNLFMRFIFLNQKYIDQDQVVRLTDKDLTVNKDNLAGDFDYIVNSGMGAGSKETDTQNMLAVINMMPTLIQGGIATQDNAYKAVKKYLSLIGIKNYSDYIIEPSQQPQKPPAGPKAAESIKVTFESLPINAKVQLLTMLGLQVTPQDFIQDIALQQQQANTDTQVKAQADIAKTGAKTQGDLLKIAAQHLTRQKETVLNGQIRATASNINSGTGQAGAGLPNSSIQYNAAGDMERSGTFSASGSTVPQQNGSPIVY